MGVTLVAMAAMAQIGLTSPVAAAGTSTPLNKAMFTLRRKESRGVKCRPTLTMLRTRGRDGCGGALRRLS